MIKSQMFNLWQILSAVLVVLRKFSWDVYGFNFGRGATGI